MTAFTVDVHGDSLAAYRWSVPNPKTVLVVVHGYGEYAHRHERLIHAAVGAGVEVWAIDLYGHGMSPGIRGAVRSLDHMVDAAMTFALDARKAHPNAELVLFGHSMGGLVALHTALRFPDLVQRLALSAPATQDGGERPAFLMAVAPIIAKLIPNLPIVELPATGITADLAQQKRYDEDENIYRGKMRASAGWAILHGGQIAHEQIERLKPRTLIMHGDEDTLAAHAGSVALAANNPRITLDTVVGGRHELHHESEESGIPQRYINTMLRWIVTGKHETQGSISTDPQENGAALDDRVHASTPE